MFGISSYSESPFASLGQTTGANDVFGSAAVNGTAFVTADGTRILFFAGSINGTATVSSSAIRIRLGDASINGTAEVDANGGVINNGVAAIDGITTFVCLPNAVWAGNSQISGNAIILVDGRIIGDEWGITTEDVNTWTPVSGGSNTWTELTAQSDNWTRQ